MWGEGEKGGCGIHSFQLGISLQRAKRSSPRAHFCGGFLCFGCVGVVGVHHHPLEPIPGDDTFWGKYAQSFRKENLN